MLPAPLPAAPPRPPAADVVVMASDTRRVTCPPAFGRAACPFVVGGTYLIAEARPGGRPAVVRVAAPEGTWYVYLGWARHPQGARSVAVRVGGNTVRVDQSLLANRADPDALPHDDMAGYEGVCTSGLCRLTERPVRFRRGERVEIARADGEPGRITTFNYVVFSPRLYLDDMGSDARLPGRPTLSLRDHVPALGDPAGAGVVFVPPADREASVELTVPAGGTWIVEANPNMGPTRAKSMPLSVRFPDGRAADLALKGRAGAFGRGGWQPLGVLRNARGAVIAVRPAAAGWTCLDLLRLTPVSEEELSRPETTAGFDRFTLQWEEPSAARPWLREVTVAGAGGVACETVALEGRAGLPHGLEVRLPRRRLAVIGEPGGPAFTMPSDGSFQVRLAGDCGFTLSTELLRREGFLWLKDLGMFACAGGDWASRRAETRALEARARAADRRPFVSTAERYRRFTGYDEARPGQDDQAFRFAYDPTRPILPRAGDAIARMPEADYGYFAARVPEPRHRRMFLGWPDVCQEFSVLSNGTVGVSSGSGQGTGHPPAEHFSVAFGAGDPAAFREHGDPSVRQSIEDGYHLVCDTSWDVAAGPVRASALAYPLQGEEVRTGNEPLAAFVRLSAPPGGPVWLRIRPDPFGGPANPLTGLGEARMEGGMLRAGRRIVLAVARARTAIADASDREVLLRLDPDGGPVEVVIPYVAVPQDVVEAAVRLGFDAARERMKRFWDARLARGARIETPDPVVNGMYRTLYVRTMITGDLDADGLYVLKTSPIVYDLVWLHATAYGIEGLARRGHFEEARRYLDAVFRWQGCQPAQDAPGYTSWEGFFNAPPRYTPLLWINFHGWTQWAAARYCLFSGDRAWLDRNLPALIRSLEWTASQRRLTMREGPDGARPASWGWLPPARVTDGSTGTSAFGDCINWMGFDELTRLLERIGHPRAAEFRAVADDYRACILRGLRLAARDRLPVRLNDGTWTPYVPGYLDSSGHEETMWYAAVVDGGLEGVLDSGILPPGDPVRGWVQANLQDNLFVIAPNLADEAYFLGHACDYLRSDQPELAVYTFYSVLASHMARQTRTTFEHRSWGAGRVWELAPWPMGYFTRLLAGMLCWDEGDGLVYGRATPRAWLDPGKTIRVERLQTRYGPTSFRLEATEDVVRGSIETPARPAPDRARLRLRINGTLEAVTLNGREATIEGDDTVTLPAEGGTVEVVARVRR